MKQTLLWRLLTVSFASIASFAAACGNETDGTASGGSPTQSSGSGPATSSGGSSQGASRGGSTSAPVARGGAESSNSAGGGAGGFDQDESGGGHDPSSAGAGMGGASSDPHSPVAGGLGGSGGEAGGGAGAEHITRSCCTAHSSPGCAEPAVQACVCAKDPACCSGVWDEFCALLAATPTANGACTVCAAP